MNMSLSSSVLLVLGVMTVLTQGRQYYYPPQQSLMDALFSMAQNDDLQCIPKILCEITSGGTNNYLPVKLDLESLTTFLSRLNSVNMSPVLHFGKAAVLGFASEGSKSCHNAYPQCPSDPDKLIQYLNNHNGGFFRFFQGVKPYPDVAEARIQNRPTQFVPKARKIKFPSEGSLDIQRPLPNHVPSSQIFPVRTGTGELKLDFQGSSDYQEEPLAYDVEHYTRLLYESFPSSIKFSYN